MIPEPTELTTEKERSIDKPTRARYDIHVDDITNESLREIQAGVDYIAGVKEWDDPIAKIMKGLYKDAEPKGRTIRVQGRWPDVEYSVIDHAFDNIEGYVTTANFRLSHARLQDLKSRLSQ